MNCDKCNKELEIENILLKSGDEIEVTYCPDCRVAYVSMTGYEVEIDE